MIRTVNNFVYAINGEVWKLLLLANDFSSLVKQCIKSVGLSFDIVGEGKMES